MASRQDLQAKREQAIRLNRSVSQKISRHRTQKDVELAGTKHDVRVSPQAIAKMNSRQLESLAKRQASFVSRETQFVRGADTRSGQQQILPVHGRYGVKAFLKNQTKLNKDKLANLAGVADLQMPSSGMTVGQYVKAMIPDHPVTAAPSSYPVHLPFTKAPRGINGEKSLKTLAKRMEKDQGGFYFTRKYKNQFKGAKEIIYGKKAGIKNTGLTKDFKSLTPQEFSFLWNYTDFSKMTALDYVVRKSFMHDKTELAWYDQTLDTQIRQARKRIAEVKALKLGGRL